MILLQSFTYLLIVEKLPYTINPKREKSDAGLAMLISVLTAEAKK
jgi:hypothetical protein